MTTAQLKRQRKILAASYLNYHHKLRRYAISRTSNAELGEDLVQHTYLKAWAYMMKGGEINAMEAFLYNVLKSLIIDEYRKRKTLSLDSMIDNGFDVGEDHTDRLADAIDGEQAVELITRLPNTYKKVVSLRYLNDLSLSEIANITGETKNTVAVKSHRGLAKLKILMDQEMNRELVWS